MENLGESRAIRRWKFEGWTDHIVRSANITNHQDIKFHSGHPPNPTMEKYWVVSKKSNMNKKLISWKSGGDWLREKLLVLWYLRHQIEWKWWWSRTASGAKKGRDGSDSIESAVDVAGRLAPLHFSKYNMIIYQVDARSSERFWVS